MTERRDERIPAGDTHLAAWLYEPAGEPPFPAVVMAHGFGMTRGCRLPAWAERFAGEGLAAVVFDYRGWGDSGGRPRQVLDIGAQRRDWRTAVGWTRQRDIVDEDRVALWGTSFSGGHVLHTAARDPAVAAVVAQVPFVDGPATLRAALTAGGPAADGGAGGLSAIPRTLAGSPVAWARQLSRLSTATTRDLLAARTGGEPVLLPVAGEIGSGAVIAAPGAGEGIRTLVPGDVPWRNEVAARIVAHLPLDRPGRDAGKIDAPLLACVCEEDRITPPGPARAVVRRAPRSVVRGYALDHFAAYTDPGRAALLADQTAFLRTHLTDDGP